jgi:hypothetical protein
LPIDRTDILSTKTSLQSAMQLLPTPTPDGRSLTA